MGKNVRTDVNLLDFINWS